MKYEYTDISEEDVLALVRQHLTDVMGGAESLSTDIDMDTKFGSDLELESIEFVALASQLSAEFGDSVNFVEFLSTKTLDEIVSLSVGDVVRYVATCLRKNKSLQGAPLNG